MSNVIITVESLSKKYVIGHQRAKGDGLRHSIEDALRNPLAWLTRKQQERAATTEEFWALKDVSFEVKRGEVIGVIGRNGAGKSTLLKILSRITEPTSGRIRLRGRVASLLEVGTGFHPELTGRENIFLNGAILGMSKAEIIRKFDEIVAFSEVEKFLDTPVKRYSSGMYVRLAFAVAAHLEPEILIVDEVLAVGDTAFQEKCLGKIKAVASGGRTVLFVSHNMQAVSVLCSRALFLDSGTVNYTGIVKETIERYIAGVGPKASNSQTPDRRPGSGEYRFIQACPSKDYFSSDEEKVVRFEIVHHRHAVSKMWLSAFIVDASGTIIAQCDSRLVGLFMDDREQFAGTFRFSSPWLKPGNYRIDLFICATGIVDAWEGACSLTVSPMLPYTCSASEDGTKAGMVFADFTWNADGPTGKTGGVTSIGEGRSL